MRAMLEGASGPGTHFFPCGSAFSFGADALVSVRTETLTPRLTAYNASRGLRFYSASFA